MTIEIRDHRIVGAQYIASPNHGGIMMKPDGAVMHWTAGATAQSAIDTFRNPATNASAHFVIHPDGDVTQMVPLNVSAWHAGPSIMFGRRNANRWTHGFEIVNPGFYTVRNGEYWDWSGKRKISDAELAVWQPKHHQKLGRIGGGTYAFPAFKEASLKTALDILTATSAYYEYSKLSGHDEIDTRGWKVDPGPLFPWDRFDAVMGGEAPERGAAVNDAPRGDVPEVDARRGADLTGRRLKVSVTSLRVRRGPGTNWEVLTSITKGEIVEVLRDEGDWCRIAFDGGKIGWVADRFLEPVA